MEKSIVINDNRDTLNVARGFVREILAQRGVDEEEVFNVVLATDEWVSNVISHAYKSKGSGKIEIKIQLRDSKCVLIFRDQGESFDYYSVKEPNISECIRKKTKSGFGISLIKKLMDEVEYLSLEKCNQFKMVKGLKMSKDRIADFLNEKAVNHDLASRDKKGVINELVDLLVSNGSLNKKSKPGVVKILLDREALGSTGIGQGIAIPHGKTAAVKSLVAAFGLSRKGVNFESLDGEPAYIFFLLLAPKESAGPHLKALAKISRLLKEKFFRDTLKNCKDKKTLMKIISKEEERNEEEKNRTYSQN